MSLIAIIIIALVAEVFLDSTWNSIYFRYGLLLFRKRFQVGRQDFRFPSTEKLNENFYEGMKMPSLVFKEVGENQIGVREKCFQVTFAHYASILHGNIEYDPLKNELTLKCFSNLTVTVLLFGVGAAKLPSIIKEILAIGTYGNPIVNASFLLFIGCLILAIPFGIAMYQILRFKKVVAFLIE